MTRPILACAAVSLLALAVAASAQGAGWLPLTPALNGTHASIMKPRVVVDDAGNVYAAWLEGSLLEVSKRPVGGVFEKPQTIDPTAPATPSDVDIGVDGAGNAVLIWRGQASSGAQGIFQARRAAAATSFGSGTQLSNVSDTNIGQPDLAVNRTGEAVVGYKNNFNSTDEISIGVGTASGGFAPGTLRIYTDTSPLDPQVAINEAGDVAAVWSANGAVRAAYRPRSAAFPSGASESVVSGPNQVSPDVALDSTGRTLAIWTDGVNIRAATRPSGPSQAWGNPQPVDALTNFANTPHAAFDAGDGGSALWAGDRALRFATFPGPGSSFGTAQDLAPANEDPGRIEIDSSPQGTSVGVWDFGDPGGVRAVVRPSGGAFGSITTLNPSGVNGDSPDAAVDPQGNAAAVWVQTSFSNPPALVTAEYDATAPHFPNTPTAPDTATVGVAVPFSGAPADDWSTPSISWDFGDGQAPTVGDDVTHTYTAPGSYVLSAYPVDLAGNFGAPFTKTITVTPAQVPPDEPTRGVDFNASRVKGTVLVSVPVNGFTGRVLARRPVARSAAAISPPAGYTPFRLLGKDDNIPVGAILDSTKGTSAITMATNKSGTSTQTGQFSQGVYKTKQTTKKPLTTAVLLGGGNFKQGCKRPRRQTRLGSRKVEAARKRPHRRLFANVHGRFRTRGRHSTATVRGTKFLTKDTCSGTTTIVMKGTVVVRDLVKNKNHPVRAGPRFTARPRGLRRRR